MMVEEHFFLDRQQIMVVVEWHRAFPVNLKSVRISFLYSFVNCCLQAQSKALQKSVEQ